MRRNVLSQAALSLLVLLAAATLAVDGQTAAQQKSEIQRKALLQQDLPIPGYNMVMNLVEIPAGVSEIRHTHPGTLAGYIVEGTLTLEHEGRPTATYAVGQSFVVDAGKIHQGINAGSGPVKLVATLIVEKGKPQSSPAP